MKCTVDVKYYFYFILIYGILHFRKYTNVAEANRLSFLYSILFQIKECV